MFELTTKQNSKVHLVLGGPGTGKTYRLLQIMEEELNRGIPPERIAFVSFTRKAAREAAERAAKKFGWPKSAFPYCRTIHSLGHQELGVLPGQVVNPSKLKEFGKFVACKISDKDGNPHSKEVGDRAINMLSYSRATGLSLRAVWELNGRGMTWPWIEWFEESYQAFKKSRCLVDFSDMLGDYVRQGQPIPVDVAIIDEAQDLSRLQWKFVKKAFSEAQKIYVAGDDMQAIFVWNGADIDTFLNLKADTKEVIPKSYRLAPDVLGYSERVINRVRSRYKKSFAPATDRAGRVCRHNYLNTIPFDAPGSWLLLARTNYQLRQFEKHMRLSGYLYSTKYGRSINEKEIDAAFAFEDARAGKTLNGKDANLVLKMAGEEERFSEMDSVRFSDLGLPNLLWHEVLLRIPFGQRSYYLSALNRGGKLRGKPRFHIGTIHSVKGGEADHVAIISDMTDTVYEGYRENPDAEFRTWYVGITRTRGNLHILNPRQPKHYPI